MPAEKIPFRDVQAVPSREGRTLAIVSSDGVAIHDAVSGREVRRFPATANRRVNEAFLSHDGKRVAIVERPAKAEAIVGGGGGLSGDSGGGLPAPVPWTSYVTVLDAASGQPIRKWETQMNVALAFAPDRPTLAILERPANAPGMAGMGMGMPGGMMMMGGGGSADAKSTARLGLWDFAPAK